MKALVLESDKNLVYKDIDAPKPDERCTVLVRVAAAGICGSDIGRGFRGGAYHYPLVMGHEFSGVVVENRSGNGIEIGSRVAVFPLIPCLRCAACRSGDYAQCADYDYLGSRRDGAFAEYVWAPPENLFTLPEGLSLVHAAMAEPVAVALHGIRHLERRRGRSAVVFGGGPIGNVAAQLLARDGAGPVFVVEIDEKKKDIARGMGFVTVDPNEGDVVAQIMDHTREAGAGICVEACGLPQTFVQAIRATSVFGQVLFMGNINGAFELPKQDVSSILRKELRIYGTWNSKVTPRGDDDWTGALQALTSDMDVSPLISHTPRLESGVEIFNAMVNRTECFNKVIFEMPVE